MNARQNKLIDRLKNGKIKKADGSFTHDGGAQYCILGAITKCYQEETGKEMFKDGEYKHSDECAVQPEVKEYYSLTSVNPPIVYAGEKTTLVELNDDSNLSIRRIACQMEKQADLIFEDKVTLEEFIGGKLPFKDAHLEAASREHELQKTGGRK